VIACLPILPSRGARSASEEIDDFFFEPQEAAPLIGGAEMRQAGFYQRRASRELQKRGGLGQGWIQPVFPGPLVRILPYFFEAGSGWISIRRENRGFRTGSWKKVGYFQKVFISPAGMGAVYLHAGLSQDFHCFFPFLPGDTQADAAVGAEVAGTGISLWRFPSLSLISPPGGEMDGRERITPWA